jgi:hypothetical protein
MEIESHNLLVAKSDNALRLPEVSFRKRTVVILGADAVEKACARYPRNGYRRFKRKVFKATAGVLCLLTTTLI